MKLGRVRGVGLRLTARSIVLHFPVGILDILQPPGGTRFELCPQLGHEPPRFLFGRLDKVA